MADMCDNILQISGPAKHVLHFKTEAVGFDPWCKPILGQKPEALSFHSLIPIPEAVLAAGYDREGYDWECNHWGCKWGACHSAIIDEWEGNLIYGFETAWYPPLTFIKQVSRKWPALTFELDYREECAHFRQTATIQAGGFGGS